jgi:hypothetical protein
VLKDAVALAVLALGAPAHGWAGREGGRFAPFAGLRGLVDEQDYSIKVSTPVLDALTASFNHLEERMYFLLANRDTRCIDKITDKFCYGDHNNVWVEDGFPAYLGAIAEKENYVVAGFYHSHTRHAQAKDLLSAQDRDFQVGDALPNAVIHLLGHESERIPFRIRAFVPLRDTVLGKDARRSEAIDEFRRRNLLARSSDTERIQEDLELRIRPQACAADPDATDMLKRYPPFIDGYETTLSEPLYKEIIESVRFRYFPGSRHAYALPYPVGQHKGQNYVFSAGLRPDGVLLVHLYSVNGGASSVRRYAMGMRILVRGGIIDESASLVHQAGRLSILDSSRLLPKLTALLAGAPERLRHAWAVPAAG